MSFEHFSFARVADDFDNHIARSIPGYDLLQEACVRLSRRFVQHDTNVVDIGCSTGATVRRLAAHNNTPLVSAHYLGLDCEVTFGPYWRTNAERGVTFRIGDCRSFRYQNVSFAISLFTIQFLRPSDKLSVLRSLYRGMLPGGGLLIAEKIYAGTGRMQDALTFPYYDAKADFFSAHDILEKERRLRGRMTLWTLAELRQNLKRVGFHDLEIVWSNFPFVAVLALR